jgi:hypothetical protein
MGLDVNYAQVKHSTSWSSEALLADHSALLSIFLHLLPGAVTGAVAVALLPAVVAAGYPPHVALVLSIPLAMIPVQLGLLLFLGYKRNGRLSLQGVVLNRESIRIRKYLVYVPLVFMASLAVIGIGGAVLDNTLRKMFFAWMASFDWNLSGGYTRAMLVVSISLTLLFVTLGESVVEELYFRGFLLPRMRYAKRGTTVLHSFLFALYHVWQPWRLISIAFGMLPIVFAVRRTRNIYVGMIAHMLLNSYDVILGVAFILAMTVR